jgi:hypothetical protein
VRRRLLLDEFGHPILRLRSGLSSVDTLVHAEQVLGLDNEGSIAAPAVVRDSSHGRPNRRCGQTSDVWSGSRLCENAREQRMRRIVFSLVPLRP